MLTFTRTLVRSWNIFNEIKLKREEKLPTILSCQEVRIIYALPTLQSYTFYLTLYSLGVRLREAITLQVSDILMTGERSTFMPEKVLLIGVLKSFKCMIYNNITAFYFNYYRTAILIMEEKHHMICCLTKGYNLEHNFGHGKKHLSTLLAAFNILAFLFHTFLDLVDEKYQMVRKKLPTRKTFFDDIRALTRYICFDNWNDLLIFMMKGLELDIPDTS